MIIPKTGSLFDSGAEALVSPVNCLGVAGAGLAKAFRERYPSNHLDYVWACRRRQLRPGLVHLHRLRTLVYPRYIVNFPTKDDWRNPSKDCYIRDGLLALVRVMALHSIRSVAIPALGCGLGGLEWVEVRAMVFAAFDTVPDVDVLLYEPNYPT